MIEAMRFAPRTSTKPTEIQENARKVAMDAFLEGRIEDGKRILQVERVKLSKPQAKKVAGHLAKQGRFDDATAVLVASSWIEAQAKEELAPPPTAKVGDILYSSWGYDQTNIDFYEVVTVSGSSATIRKIAENRLPSDSRYDELVTPKVGTFVGPPKKKRVQKTSYGGSYKIKVDDSETAYPWDGKPKRQTAAGYGH